MRPLFLPCHGVGTVSFAVPEQIDSMCGISLCAMAVPVAPYAAAAKARSAFREPKLPKDAYACLKGPDMAYLERNHADCTVT